MMGALTNFLEKVEQGLPRAIGDPMPKVQAAKGKRIDVNDIVMEFHTQIGLRRVVDGVSFSLLPGEKIAVLGRNGAGKSTLVKIIGGVLPPVSGDVYRGMSMSWPIAFSGGFEAGMTGLDNIRFLSRIYDRPFDQTAKLVDDFAELGRHLFLPVKTYSSGMRARLAFGLTLAIDFDCFLIDEVIAVGDHHFHDKCHHELFVKRKNCAMILVSHDVNIIKQYCNKALVLKNGRGRVLDDVKLAIDIYHSM